MLYEVCLDDPEYVETVMDLYRVAGPFPSLQPFSSAAIAFTSFTLAAAKRLVPLFVYRAQQRSLG